MAYCRTERIARRLMHSCARERENERNPLGQDGRGGEGQRSNKFRAGKNGTVGYERLMERRAKVRARKAAPVSGFARPLSSDSDHQTRKSRHPESSSALTPPAPGLRPLRSYMRWLTAVITALSVCPGGNNFNSIIRRFPSPLPPSSLLGCSLCVVFITGSGLTTAQERPFFRYRDMAP